MGLVLTVLPRQRFPSPLPFTTMGLAISGHVGSGEVGTQSLAPPALPVLLEWFPFFHMRHRKLFSIKRDFHLLSLFLSVLWKN